MSCNVAKNSKKGKTNVITSDTFQNSKVSII